MSSNVTINEMMMETGPVNIPPTVSGRLLRIGAVSIGVLVLLALAFGALTWKWAGNAGLTAMAAGMIISLVSNMLGAVPNCMALATPTKSSPTHLLGGMLLRIVILGFLTVPVTWADVVPREPMLLWLAGSYCALLMVETTMVAIWFNRSQVKS